LAALVVVTTALLLAASGCEDDVTDLEYLEDGGAQD
jgi:hypothetical protein